MRYACMVRGCGTTWTVMGAINQIANPGCPNHPRSQYIEDRRQMRRRSPGQDAVMPPAVLRAWMGHERFYKWMEQANREFPTLKAVVLEPKGPDPRQFERDRQILMDYMQLAYRLRDWHGVSDAANDLRTMEAAHRGKFDVGSPD